jgi:hypothetical protein
MRSWPRRCSGILIMKLISVCISSYFTYNTVTVAKNAYWIQGNSWSCCVGELFNFLRRPGFTIDLQNNLARYV